MATHYAEANFAKHEMQVYCVQNTKKKIFDFALLTIEICFVGGDQDLETYFVHDNITWSYIHQKSS